MNPMCAFRSSDDQSPTAHSPFPRGAFIINMNFIDLFLRSRAPIGAFTETSELTRASRHAQRTFSRGRSLGSRAERPEVTIDAGGAPGPARGRAVLHARCARATRRHTRE